MEGKMNYRTNWQTLSKGRMVLLMIAIMALWANIATAMLNDDLIIAAARGDLAAVKQSIAKGADVNARDKGDLTALRAAAQNGHVEIVQVLLAEGANVNAITTTDWTALKIASKQGHQNVVEQLIKAGAK
jgi:ankyrin repeat protein